MLCQNCGRRSSDTKSFCQHCGAIATDDLQAVASPPVSQRQAPKRATVPSRPQPRPPVSRPATMRPAGTRPAPSSNALGTLIFWGLVAYGGYWFLSDDGRDLRSLVNDVIRQQREQAPASAPAPPPRTVPPAVAEPPPAAAAKPAPPEAPVERRADPPPAKPGVANPALADPGIEGFSPAQVIQKLGRPPSVITLNGVTGWSYRDGALIVYFVKDRATLKPPR